MAARPGPAAHLAHQVAEAGARATRGTRRPGASGRARGSAACGPALPPGCERAKSRRKPARPAAPRPAASPSAICAVVLAVGARFSGQASWSTRCRHHRSACAPAWTAVAGHRHQRTPRRRWPAGWRRARRSRRCWRWPAPRRRRDHAQVAVAGLGRVDEERRRAGGRQRGGDLAAPHGRSCPCPSRPRGRGGCSIGLHRGAKPRPGAPPGLQRTASMSKVWRRRSAGARWAGHGGGSWRHSIDRGARGIFRRGNRRLAPARHGHHARLLRCCTCSPRCWAWWPAARSSCRRCWATWWWAC